MRTAPGSRGIWFWDLVWGGGEFLVIKKTTIEGRNIDFMFLGPFPHTHTHTHTSVADPGFPRGGAPTLQGGPTYDFAKFS